jgi:four helix bundle protein
MMSEIKENIIVKKSYDFALKIINLYKVIVSEHKEYVLSKQLLRSGTSIGALVKEAEHAQSKKDFINKMNIALKEASETEYCLHLLKDSNFVSKTDFEFVYQDNKEIIRLLFSIVKTSKINS